MINEMPPYSLIDKRLKFAFEALVFSPYLARDTRRDHKVLVGRQPGEQSMNNGIRNYY